MTAKSLTLVVGGARSGKSRYAQELATGFDEVVFLATAQPSDAEMKAKIERHRNERPSAWKTVEVPFDLDRAIDQHGKSSRFLIVDCLTTYTANLFVVKQESCQAIMDRIDLVCRALLSTQSSVALISNEVGGGIVPEFASGRAFRDLLGEVNQRVARICHHLVLMVAGYPLPIKSGGQPL